eukprot:g5505.t1
MMVSCAAVFMVPATVSVLVWLRLLPECWMLLTPLCLPFYTIHLSLMQDVVVKMLLKQNLVRIYLLLILTHLVLTIHLLPDCRALFSLFGVSPGMALVILDDATRMDFGFRPLISAVYSVGGMTLVTMWAQLVMGRLRFNEEFLQITTNLTFADHGGREQDKEIVVFNEIGFYQSLTWTIIIIVVRLIVGHTKTTCRAIRGSKKKKMHKSLVLRAAIELELVRDYRRKARGRKVVAAFASAGSQRHQPTQEKTTETRTKDEGAL